MHRKAFLGAFAGLGVLLVLMAAARMMRPDPFARELTALKEKAGVFDGRLRVIEAKPTGTGGQEDPVELLRQLVARAKDLEGKVRTSVGEGHIDQARTALQALEAMPARADAAIKSARNPAPASGARALEVQGVINGLQETEEVADALSSRAREARHALTVADTEKIVEDLRAAMTRARRLVPRKTPAPPAGELDKSLAQLKSNLSKARQTLGAYVPPPEIPFEENEATLVIMATSDLAENLVVPMLKSRSGGEAVSAQGQIWHYTSKPGFKPEEKIVVKAVSEGPLRSLVEEQADLILSEIDPSPDEIRLFKQKFPEQTLRSRSISDVVALDALTMLAHPDSREIELSYEQARDSAWIGGQVGSVEHDAAQRFGFKIAQTVDQPVDAVLINPANKALSLYHRNGRVRAKRIAYTPGGGVPALEPSPFTIASKDYKFAFDIIATYSPRSRPAASQVVNFMIGNAGQDVVSDRGYVDRRLRGGKKSVDPTVLAVLGRVLGSNVKGATKAPTDIRFPFDEFDLSPRAQSDLAQLPDYVAREYSKAQVVILGFTDNVGTTEYNLDLSQKRAKAVAGKLVTSIPDIKHGGLGHLLPSDNNATPEGQARNRRVEVWVVTD